MSDEPMEAPGDDEAPTASGYMTLLGVTVQGVTVQGVTVLGADERAEYEDLVGKIRVRSVAARDVEGERMGPTVEVRFFGVRGDRLFHLMLDAVEAQDLALLLAHRAGVAIEESRGASDA